MYQARVNYDPDHIIRAEDAAQPEKTAELLVASDHQRYLSLRQWAHYWIHDTVYYLKEHGKDFPDIKNRHKAAILNVFQAITGIANPNLPRSELDKNDALYAAANDCFNTLFQEHGADGAAAACMRLLDLQVRSGMKGAKDADRIKAGYPFKSLPELIAAAPRGTSVTKELAQDARKIRSWCEKSLNNIPDLIRAVAEVDGLQVVVSPPGRLRYNASRIYRHQNSIGMYDGAEKRAYLSGWHPYQQAALVEETTHHVFENCYKGELRETWRKAMECDHASWKGHLGAIRIFNSIKGSNYAKGNYAFDDSSHVNFFAGAHTAESLRKRYRLPATRSRVEVFDYHYRNVISESPIDVLRVAMYLKNYQCTKGNLSKFTQNDFSTVDGVMRDIFPNTYPLFVGPREGFSLYADESGRVYEIEKGIKVHEGLKPALSFSEACKIYIRSKGFDLSAISTSLFPDDLPIMKNGGIKGFSFPGDSYFNAEQQLVPIEQARPATLAERYIAQRAVDNCASKG
ncbi:MAG: hypothetical protein U1E36_08880 [Rickettsiales bacterium]